MYYSKLKLMKNYSIFPKVSQSLTYITTDQMMEVDRLMIKVYGINLFQMMENAGRCLAIVAREKVNHNKDKNILVIAGSGGNGGGGMTAARRLHYWGYNVEVLLTSGIEKHKGTIGAQLRILQKTGIDIYSGSGFDFSKKYDVIIDAMIGYSLKGKLKSNIIEMVEWTNAQNANIISLDVPSGMDSTTGQINSICIKANQTMTLALPKTGFQNPETMKYTGELLLADISVPPLLYKKAFDIDMPDVFRESDIVRV